MEAVSFEYKAYKPRPFTKEERPYTTILLGGLTFKHERLITGNLSHLKTLFSISSITCIASIFLSVLELLQVLTINQSTLWMPKVDIFLQPSV